MKVLREANHVQLRSVILTSSEIFFVRQRHALIGQEMGSIPNGTFSHRGWMYVRVCFYTDLSTTSTFQAAMKKSL